MNATAITDGVLTIDGVPATPIFGAPLPIRLLVGMSPAIDQEHLVGAVAQCAVRAPSSWWPRCIQLHTGCAAWDGNELPPTQVDRRIGSAVRRSGTRVHH